MAGSMVGIDTDLGDQLVKTLSAQSQTIQDQLSALQSKVNDLLSSWEGNSRNTFDSHWSEMSQAISKLIQQLEELANQLSQVIQRFIEADQAPF